jgi:glucose-1-phosphate cytidylyltransferase
VKVVLLAGGLGTRLTEETAVRPKPMIEIGGRPLLWHLMKIYSSHELTEFIVCLGYKGYVIKEYFANYPLHMSDVTVDVRSGDLEVHRRLAEPWKVTLVDTGEFTATGGRLKRVREYLGSTTFCMTYGDGIGNVDIRKLIMFHRENGRLATITATQPPGRFGALDVNGSLVTGFREKPRGDGSWVNGGFFVLEPAVLDYISGDDMAWERAPLERLAREGQLAAYPHEGFWQPVDTLRDKNQLEDLWQSGAAPWKTWR